MCDDVTEIERERDCVYDDVTHEHTDPDRLTTEQNQCNLKTYIISAHIMKECIAQPKYLCIKKIH